MKFGKLVRIISWAVGAVCVASIAWAASGFFDSYGNMKNVRSTVLLSEGQTSNCRLSISGSTLSVVGSDGNALSTSNPCVVGVRSSTGAVVSKSFTSAVSVTFGAASDTDGNLFGITDANWANDLNMKLGVIYNDTDAYFTISRVSSYVSGAAATDLCQKADSDCDSQGDVMVLATGLTLADWVSLPITQAGWFPATYATAGGAWTFATTTPAGFNFEYAKLWRVFPILQMGATSGHCRANGGTCPTWTNDYVYYRETTRDGMVHVLVRMDGDAGADGAGAVTAQVALPFVFVSTSTSYAFGAAMLAAAGAGYNNNNGYVGNGSSLMSFSLGSANLLQWGAMLNGSRQIYVSVVYSTL